LSNIINCYIHNKDSEFSTWPLNVLLGIDDEYCTDEHVIIQAVDLLHPRIMQL
ncbi:hypothetical protein L9F63_003740, partial [Diploptera punctata]